MPNITRGGRMAGLVTYLVGPGRANEHTDQHLVAGDPALMAWHGDDELNRDSAFAIAKYLDAPSRVFGTEVKAGLYEWDPAQERNVRVGYGDAHVWHCSLSLRAEEGVKSDEQWAAIATAFVERMGFGDEQGTKAGTRWAAVRHGVSKNGNDHVHLVVNLVREDGTKASVHMDRVRAQRTARELEREFGLQELDTSRPSIGVQPGERQADARRRARATYEQVRADGGGVAWEALSAVDRNARISDALRSDEPRHDLARRVRACATASRDEGEFVRRMRRTGLIVRPRYAAGREDVVTGYSVASRPVGFERPVWFGGGHLAHDLTLPRLRAEWPDSPQHAGSAVAEWTAARRGQRPVTQGVEAAEPDPALWDQYATQLATLREQLRAVPFTDRDTWEHVARKTAGVFAAWSLRVEAEPGPLAAAADSLARSAHSRRPGPRRADPRSTVSLTGAAALFAMAINGGQGAGAQLLMLRQLVALAGAIYDAHRAGQEYRRALELRTTVQSTREAVEVKLRAATPPAPASELGRAGDAVRLAQLGQQPAQRSTNPLPTPLERERHKLPSGPPRAPDVER